MTSRDERPTGAETVRIELAARLVGLPSARVRRYLKVGLIQPASVDRRGPLLGAEALARLRRIRRLTTDLGLNLAGVEIVLRLLDELDTLRAAGELSRAEVGSGESRALGAGNAMRRKQE